MSGSCRDLAVFMIAALRSLGIAARFVSGYLHLADDDDDDRLTGGNTHAWVQVYVPGPGWVDFDPSSGTVGNQNLVRVAVVHDPREAIPLQGTWIGPRVGPSRHESRSQGDCGGCQRTRRPSGHVAMTRGRNERRVAMCDCRRPTTKELSRGDVLTRHRAGLRLCRSNGISMKIRAGYDISYECPAADAHDTDVERPPLSYT